jgi:hypothetical protein
MAPSLFLFRANGVVPPRSSSRPPSILSVPKEHRCTPNFYALSPRRDMRISSRSDRTQAAQEAIAPRMHCCSLDHVSGWAHSSFGQAPT